jgi:lipopolysaccharide assembly outer membrane protein LptD (OstA)
MRGLSEEGLVEFDEQSGVATDPAGVEVTYEDATLTARRVQINRQSGEIAAEGNVRLQQGRQLWTGDSLRYNFFTRDVAAGNFRAGMAPFFVAGEGLDSAQTNQVRSATNATITTDDLYTPGYRVRARSIRIVPGEYIEAKGATLYLGKVPVMYFPTYRNSLRYHRNFWVVTPGYRSLYGLYVLNAYHWNVTTNLEAVLNFDYRVKRGLGGGPDLHYDLGRAGRGQIKSYYTWDDDPPEEPTGVAIDADRYRINFAHSTFVSSNLTAKAAVRWQSDATVIRDFFETEYREDVQPKSFLEVNQLWPNFSLNLLAVGQVNDFYQTIERLPDLKLTAARQQLGVSPFYYESDTSAAYLRYRSNDLADTNYAAFRADTYHQLLLPQTFFGWLNVTPRVGGRFTYYGAFDEWNDPRDEGSSERWVLNTGAEVSTKISRVWPDARNRLFEVQGLRHIAEPSVNYVFVPAPSEAPRDLPQFDYEFRSFELLPVDFPDYNAVDSVDANNVFRLGLRNKLQTKRGEGIENVVNWLAVVDWRADPRADQQTFSDLYSDLDFKPRSWLTLNSEIRFDLNQAEWNLANHTITLQPNSIWHWKVGHRYLREQPGYGPTSANDLYLSSLFVRLNENWAVRLTHHFEARDSTMEEQYYTIYRDFRSWTGALTLRLRDNRDLGEDWTIAFSFSLKAYPRFKLGEDRDKPSLLLGG